MSSNYQKNIWKIHDPNKSAYEQPDAYITKSKLDKMEEGIEDANIPLEIGEITTGEIQEVTIVNELDESGDLVSRKLNITFPPAGQGAKGEDGKSAYDIWIEAGNKGTETDFLIAIRGADGKDGKDGKDGQSGVAGPKGDSVYQSWLNLGNTGTEEDFMNAMKGPAGETGPQGEQGPQGEKGDTGEIGPQGLTGERGPRGLQGDQGPQGEAGPAGETGADGKSAYEVWKEIDGNENKTVEEFIKAISGSSAAINISTKTGNILKSDENGLYVSEDDFTVTKQLITNVQKSVEEYADSLLTTEESERDNAINNAIGDIGELTVKEYVDQMSQTSTGTNEWIDFGADTK